MPKTEHNRDTDRDPKRLRSLGVALGIPFILAAGPIIGYLFGNYLDGIFHTGWIKFVLLILGFIAGVRSVMRTVSEELQGDAGGVPAGEPGKREDSRIDTLQHTIGARGIESPDVYEEDGEVIGTVHYKARKLPGGGSGGGALLFSASRDSLLSLPMIIATGLWMTMIAALIAALFWRQSVGLGVAAGGVWNLLNFAVLWMTFGLLFSKSPMRIVFTLPLLCIKIPVLYFLLVALFWFNLFDHAGLLIGLLVLPVVFLYLAVLGNRINLRRT